MKQKHHSTEEIIRILRQADTDQTVESVCRDGGGRLPWIGALTDPASAWRYLQGVGPTPPPPLIPIEPHPSKSGTSPPNSILDRTSLPVPLYVGRGTPRSPSTPGPLEAKITFFVHWTDRA